MEKQQRYDLPAPEDLAKPVLARPPTQQESYLPLPIWVKYKKQKALKRHWPTRFWGTMDLMFSLPLTRQGFSMRLKALRELTCS
jgi:hypothetical protein